MPPKVNKRENEIVTAIVTQEQSQSLTKPDSLKDTVEKVLTFCEAVAGVAYYPYQREIGRRIIESLITNDGEEISALLSRQAGKSEIIAGIICGCMILLPTLSKLCPHLKELSKFKDGLWAGVFAPTFDQAHTTYERIKLRIRSKHSEMILRDPEVDIGFKKDGGGEILLSNGSLVRLQSASISAQIESKTYHLIIIEEAQDADSFKVRKSIHPMAAAVNGSIIKVGTCSVNKSDFYEVIQRNKNRMKKKGAKYNHFEYDYKIVQKYNPNYRKFIAKEKERLGETSDEFLMSYALVWMLERGMFIAEDQLNKLAQPYDTIETSDDVCVAGIDLGKKNDSTVVTILAQVAETTDGEGRFVKKVLNWLELVGDDFESQYFQILDFLKRYRIEKVIIDATGAGDVMADRLINHLGCEVIPFLFSTPKKSELYKKLSQEMLSERVIFPNKAKTKKLRTHKKFLDQIKALEKRWQGQYMVCAHPNAKDAHDDYPDSLALANWGFTVDMMPELECTDNFVFFGKRERNPLLSGRY